MDNLPVKYEKDYSEDSFWNKLKKFAKAAGIQVVYLALVLYFVMLDKNTPKRAKIIIASALGYFILPTDIIPDFILGVGYADDLGALIFAAGQVVMHLNDSHKSQARIKLKDWFGDFDPADLDEMEKKFG